MYIRLSFVNKMRVAAGLDVTNKHYTNHSIQKTIVKKLKKAGMSATEIMAIAGHKNQHSLADYNELDDEDHMHLSKILSSEKTPLSIQPSQDLESVPNHTVIIPPICDQPQPLNALASLPKYVMPSAPVFNIQNSTVIFGESSSSTLSQQFQLAHHCQKTRKRVCIIDSDSDSD